MYLAAATWIVWSLLSLTQSQGVGPQTSAPAFRLRVAVDEVVFTFHASDSHGLPVDDLTLNDVKLFDNGALPAKIVDFQLLQDFPIRAAILVDTSESMGGALSVSRAIAIKYARQMFRRQTDQAFVMDFGRLSRIVQPWTNDSNVLAAGINRIAAGGERRVAGTAVFDTIFRACLHQFGTIDHAASANFVLLFSDGEDNASSTSLREAVDMCQRANVTIYAFRSAAKASFGPTGPGTLAELAAETGGRVFRADDSEVGIDEDLRVVAADQRNRYRLVYRPADLKRDGSFHRIEMQGPERVAGIAMRSGYYAPKP
jgi:VWFA-related protein